MTWRFPWVIDGEDVLVLIRDRVDSSLGFPWHVGLELSVEVQGTSLDEATDRALHLASQHLAILSTVGRAPTGEPLPVLAYEITPGVVERDFRQWYRDLPLPLAKTSVPNLPFADVFQGCTSVTDPYLRHYVIMPMQLYAAALRQTSPVLRFMLFWPACEALDRPLRSRLSRTPKDSHWALKALAESQGEPAALIVDAYQLRNDLFHVRHETDLSRLRDRAEEISSRLEPVALRGLLTLLGLSDHMSDLPAHSVSPHPMQLILTAVMHAEVDDLNGDNHPHVEFSPAIQLDSIDDDGSIRISMPSRFTVRNCQLLSPRSVEIRGPHGPNNPRIALLGEQASTEG